MPRVPGCASFANSLPLLKVAVVLTLAVTGISAQSGADTAFQRSFRLDVPDSSGFAFMTYTVPNGMRLVIRYLAVSGSMPTGQRFTSSVQTTLRGSASDFPQAYTVQTNGDGTDELVGNQAVTIQADSNTTVYFQVFRRIPKGAVRVFFVVSGDLIVAPPG